MSLGTQCEVACVFTEEVYGDGDWAYGRFPLEEYIQALDRSKDEIYYSYSLGMRFNKRVTVVLNFQSGTEAKN
ncbi:hypothetical protein RJT34_07816 [Clitoria ternatea]|uniref:Uncharacterized protein n=1 Tax=Clitoria ternatea TaxID=43366 RepID=A0AAN9PUG4_CLITE